MTDPIRRAHFLVYREGLGPEVRWRLLSGNNRQVAIGVETHPDVESCVLAVKDLVYRLDALAPVVVRTPDSRWAWTAVRDGLPVVRGGHAFDRRIRCAEAYASFLALAASAPQPVVHQQGRR